MIGHPLEWVWEQDLRANEKIVLLAITDPCGGIGNHGGIIAIGDLAEVTGLHRATVQRILAQLEKKRLIRRHGRRDEDGRPLESRFEVCLP